jgi:1-deoxy-D-xylulose-5-phosphate reductoisomerase
MDWSRPQTWDFFPLDDEAFPAVRLARRAGMAGGTAPAVYNAANEVCVRAFLDGRLRFTEIVPTVERVLAEHADAAAGQAGPDDVPWEQAALTVDDVLAADSWARARAARSAGPVGDQAGDPLEEHHR